MNILAHRGLWGTNLEKNSIKSLNSAFRHDFGIETDLRDFQGSLVISHDPIANNKNILYFKDLLNEYKRFNYTGTIALNIKSDGIILDAEKLLKEFEIHDYFFFDMSIPQLIYAHKHNTQNIFCRHSEYESTEKVLNLTKGIWIDSFKGDHPDLESIIMDFLNKQKRIAIVSPELHRNNLTLMYNCWEKIKSLRVVEEYKQNLMLCTDHPLKAKKFFKT